MKEMLDTLQREVQDHYGDRYRNILLAFINIYVYLW